MFLSNRKLRYIIITLLLLIFCFFLGIFKPKAEALNNSPNNYYCPGGSSFSGVYNDKWYYGCNSSGNRNQKVSIDYTGLSFNGNYDVSGFIYIDVDYLTMNVALNRTACFVTTAIDTPQNNNTSWHYLQFYCFNVEINGSLNLGMEIDYETSFNNFKAGFGGRDVIVNPHFDKNNSSAITNIQNNTNNINNSINDSNIDSNNASSSASDWNNKNASNGTITQLLTLPITLLQAIVNGISSSCTSFSLGSLFGTNITLPCINLSSLIGSGLFTTIDILFSGFMILAIGKKLIKIFNDFTNLKSNQIDELYGGGK